MATRTSYRAATTSRAETCTVCGYEISPRKTSGGHGGSGGSGSHGGSGGSADTLPALNGEQKSWVEIAAELEKQSGCAAVINLNGETTVPSEVIGAIAKGRIMVEFVIDGTKIPGIKTALHIFCAVLFNVKTTVKSI